MARPVFLSYSWSDFDEADELDAQLRLRGVPVWRDRRDMLRGGLAVDRVEDAIGRHCSGFEFLCSPHALPGQSNFIHEIELPAMDQRANADRGFFYGATFLRLPIADATAALANTPGARLAATIGTPVRAGEVGARLREAAAAILSSYLETLPAGPLALEVNTYGPLPWAADPPLQLSWRPDGPRAKDLDAEPGLRERVLDRLRIKRSDQRRAELPNDPWMDDLQPALGDLHEALEARSKVRQLAVTGNMHLSAALALGYEFREPSGWLLDLDHPHVPCQTAKVAGNAHGWQFRLQREAVRPDLPLVVRVDATHDTSRAVTRHRKRCGLVAAGTLHVVPPKGPDNRSVEPAWANELAAEIAGRLVAARNKFGAPESHLYFAGPWSFATLLGWHLASAGPVLIHEATSDRNDYRASAKLGF